ncbi:MAG: tail fiber assembly protein [Oscillospiraceae bacterium]|nr:tail fiber assembly protein [Oscillospiraceae bacterium]
MRAKNTILPESLVEIEVRGDKSVIMIWNGYYYSITNDNDVLEYEYDIYLLEVNSRTDLKTAVMNNFDDWYVKAKNAEIDRLAYDIREKRKKLLDESDYLVTTDYPLAHEKLIAVQEYRQALRDIPEQDGFPYDVVFPKLEI